MRARNTLRFCLRDLGIPTPNKLERLESKEYLYSTYPYSRNS